MKKFSVVGTVVAGILALVFLYGYNPAEIPNFPRCPFLLLTGFRCPGCGTLRGLHALLHGEVATAWRLNPLMLVSIPFLISLLICPRWAYSPRVSASVCVMVITYWILRNLFNF